MKLTRLFSTSLVALAVCTALVIGGDTSTAHAQDFKSLSNGKIYITTHKVSGSDVPSMTMIAVVDAEPEKVWEIVSNCARYESRMPNIASARLIKKKGKNVRCKVEVDLPFPLSNLTAVTDAVHETSSKKWSRTWTLVKGDYDRNDGSWVLTPFGKTGKRTLVTYTVHAEPDLFVPDWAREKAQKSSFPKLLKRIRKEVKNL